MDHMLWVEKYRPSKVSDCVLPENIKNTFQDYVSRKEIPNLLLSGTAGVGKTTIAKALCQEVGCDYLLLNGSATRGIDDMRVQVKNYATSMSLSGGRKVIIIDEADYMKADTVQPALRSMIEEFSKNCRFIFTCNYKNRIIEPIHSRCTSIDFKLNGSKQKVAAQFFKRVEWILDQEGIQYSKDVVAAIITKYFPDNRRVLNEIQRYSVSGSIDTGILANIADVQINELRLEKTLIWPVKQLSQFRSKSSTYFGESLFRLQAKIFPQLRRHFGPNWIFKRSFRWHPLKSNFEPFLGTIKQSYTLLCFNLTCSVEIVDILSATGGSTWEAASTAGLRP